MGLDLRPANKASNYIIMKKKIQQRRVIKSKLVEIESKEAYELTMKKIDAFMIKGEKNLRATELKTLRTLAEAAEIYEDKFQPLLFP